MARYVAPDKGVKETVIGNSTYRPDRGGVYNVDNPKHARAMKAEGYFEAALNPYDKRDGERGFTCVQCGFGSWFLKCSRCGHENIKETKTDGE
jgi:DNA-directed RNA polymerase subunit RPC12/RpoP